MEPLSEREKEILKYIVGYRKDNFQQSPTQKEILDYLNKILPKRKGGKPALISLVQITRAVDSLRKKGLLIDPQAYPNMAGKHRNFIPTSEGEKMARKIASAKA